MKNTESARQRIVILDYGSQYTHLIARRIREHHVYSEILPFGTTAESLRADMPKGIILSGGPNSVFADGAPSIDREIFELGVPVLGICYGMQLMAQTLGGKVVAGTVREYGKAELKADCASGMFAGLPEKFVVWMSHGDRVAELPAGFKPAASSENCPYAAACDESRRFYALQFHPEVAHTQFGEKIISNFVFAICGCRADWDMGTWIEDSVAKLRAEIGDEHVILGLSGGVDSSVVAVLLNKAIGKRLHCIFVDNGLLRHGEAAEVEAMFAGKLGLDLHVAHAAQRFYKALCGAEDPETKRKIIGREFVTVFAEEARKFQNCRFLAQGTIYPDVIESSSSVNGPSQTIKSHHNVGGLPPDLKFSLVEPLRDLFKDEVRAVGRILGMDESLLSRQPFPGPGLGVRVLGEVNAEKVRLLQEADLRVQQEVRKLPDYGKIWQAFAVLLPCRSVGVMGDQRTYEYTCAIRCVNSIDAMTADWTRLPYDTLATISNRIINEVRGINRVVYDISSKPPATIEWE
ncbi:MAG: glutamine-hydrolyzing GMP synthase [Kiritimatiellae bacterium]|nr:glutamine-hydrolyzing GMP synthase [Kiritimatiellia bacterium]